MSGDKGGWVKTPGGWVPALPPRDYLTPPPLPPRDYLPYSGIDQEFLRDPLTFMHKHSVIPPARSGQSESGTVAATTVVPGSNFKAVNDVEIADQTVERRIGVGGIRHIQLIKHPGTDFPGATTLSFAPATGIQNGMRSIPIYWLPWDSLKILQCAIPAVPQSLAEWDDEAYPRFFFTAGITGCSVFVTGDSRSPTVSHAGLTNPLSLPAGQFWRDQMEATRSGFASSKIKGEINRHDYMFKDAGESKLATDYLQWRSMPGGDFKLEITSPFGCVFGMRFGRLWSFYLQKSVVVTTVRFYKKPEVDKVRREGAFDKFRNPVFDVYAKDTGLLARREPSQETQWVRTWVFGGWIPLPCHRGV